MNGPFLGLKNDSGNCVKVACAMESVAGAAEVNIKKPLLDAPVLIVSRLFWERPGSPRDTLALEVLSIL